MTIAGDTDHLAAGGVQGADQRQAALGVPAPAIGIAVAEIAAGVVGAGMQQILAQAGQLLIGKAQHQVAVADIDQRLAASLASGPT